jgi:hypothetical protein
MDTYKQADTALWLKKGYTEEQIAREECQCNGTIYYGAEEKRVGPLGTDADASKLALERAGWGRMDTPETGRRYPEGRTWTGATREQPIGGPLDTTFW